MQTVIAIPLQANKHELSAGQFWEFLYDQYKAFSPLADEALRVQKMFESTHGRSFVVFDSDYALDFFSAVELVTFLSYDFQNQSAWGRLDDWDADFLDVLRGLGDELFIDELATMVKKQINEDALFSPEGFFAGYCDHDPMSNDDVPAVPICVLLPKRSQRVESIWQQLTTDEGKISSAYSMVVAHRSSLTLGVSDYVLCTGVRRDPIVGYEYLTDDQSWFVLCIESAYGEITPDFMKAVVAEI